MRFAVLKSETIILFFFVLILCLGIPTNELLASKNKHFPVPPFLCDNVLFWKKIYTHVSTDEGLIHDRKYPLIIYQKIHVGNRRGRTLDKYVNSYKKRIADLLKEIPYLPTTAQTQEQKRIVKMFLEYSSLNDIPQAIKRIRFQLGQRESFLTGLEQSGMYIDEIFAIIKRENLPLRLAYLPHVESAFNTHAVSKAGAAGLWQFMWETGKQFLDIDRYIDERLDPILSTEAAITLLKKNYNELKSWPLAITAYNYGLAGIKRAVKATKSNDISVIIQNHKSNSFKFASKNFYSCFLAACEIDENYQRYFKHVNMDSPLLRKRFILAVPTKPDVLCKRLNISLFEFKALNPAFKESLYKYEALIPKHYTVFLPLTVDVNVAGNLIKKTNINNTIKPKLSIPKKVEKKFISKKHLKTDNDNLTLKKRLLKKAPRKQLNNKKIKYSNYSKYRVKKGDSIWLIAKKFKTNENKLRKINGLSRRSYIYPGQLLKVPKLLSKKTNNLKKQIKHSEPKNLKKIVTKKKVITQNPQMEKNISEKVITQTPQKEKIISEKLITQIPQKEKIISEKNKTFWKKYCVKDGDSLWDIAEMMNLSPEKIKKINQLKTKRIYPGQILFIPQPLTLSKQSEKDIVENSSSSENDHMSAIKRIQNLREQQKKTLIIDYYYTVKPGENLESISKKTDVAIEDIVRINYISKDLKIYEGQVLRIPKKQND